MRSGKEEKEDKRGKDRRAVSDVVVRRLLDYPYKFL
jgi:phosphoribulokinase